MDIWKLSLESHWNVIFKKYFTICLAIHVLHHLIGVLEMDHWHRSDEWAALNW